MRSIELYLDERRLGDFRVDRVRGRENWIFTYDADALDAANPMIDPAIANVRGPQFPRGTGVFGFLSDVAKGDLLGDADYYRMTRTQAQERYAFIRKVVEQGGLTEKKW